MRTATEEFYLTPVLYDTEMKSNPVQVKENAVMEELKPLSICNLEIAVDFYRKMIEENRHRDARLKNVETDDKSLRNMLQFSFDIENCLFFILYVHGRPVGFIDSARALEEGSEPSWYIKAVYLLPEFRDLENFRLMVHKVEREAQKKGIAEIFSTALIDDGEANAFWEELDFNVSPKKRTKQLKISRIA